MNRYDKSNIAIQNGFVTLYSKQNPDTLQYIDYGVNLFHKDVLDLIPASQAYSLTSLFQTLILCRQLLAYEVKDRFYQIGSLEGLSEFTDYIANIR